MAEGFPRLFADDHGVWRQDSPSAEPWGIQWDEIVCVVGGKLDIPTGVFTYLELCFEFGKWVEIYTDWLGFPDVASAISARLPGIQPGWFEAISRLGPRDAPLAVWHRPE